MVDLEQIAYNSSVLNLARKAVDLALENAFYKRNQGDIAGKEQAPDWIRRNREFQPPLSELEKALNAKDSKAVADALAFILKSIARFEST